MSKLNLTYGNILDNLNDKDIIINSNNQYMISGSGVCGSIYKMAGRVELEQYCREKFESDMKINEIRITPGFDLKINIMHIHCPKYIFSNSPIEELKQSYLNILNKLVENGYKKPISVSLGTGAYGYQHDLVAEMVVNVITEFIKNNEIDFTLILPNQQILDIYKYYQNKNNYV